VAAAGASRGVDRDGAQHHARLAHDLALAAHRDGHAEHREVEEPRRRNFRYTESQPSAGGSASSVRISSGRLARYAMPSSW